MQKIQQAHNNLALAVALHCAGCEIQDARRIYTLADEKKFDARASELAKKDKGGALRFIHAPHDNYDELVAAYNDQYAKEDLELQPFDMIAEPWKLDEMQVRLVCHALKARKHLTEKVLRDPKRAMIFEGNGEATVTEIGDMKTVHHSGFRMCSDSDKLRKELGL